MEQVNACEKPVARRGGVEKKELRGQEVWKMKGEKLRGAGHIKVVEIRGRTHRGKLTGGS